MLPALNRIKSVPLQQDAAVAVFIYSHSLPVSPPVNIHTNLTVGQSTLPEQKKLSVFLHLYPPFSERSIPYETWHFKKSSNCHRTYVESGVHNCNHHETGYPLHTTASKEKHQFSKLFLSQGVPSGSAHSESDCFLFLLKFFETF